MLYIVFTVYFYKNCDIHKFYKPLHFQSSTVWSSMLEQEKNNHKSKLTNQPLLEKFDKGAWKQMISEDSFSKVTSQLQTKWWVF